MPDTAHEQRKLAAIMFTDMVGFSALAQRNEARAIELLEIHRGIIRRVLPQHGGREVKTTGDGFLIEFPSALAAVQAAVDIQRAMHERNLASPPESQVTIRVGIHIGDVIVRDGDIHGDGVNIAARLEPLAVPGGICISSAVWELVRNKVDYPLALLGPAELKNIELPVVVHRVVMPWESAARPAPARPGRVVWIGALCAVAVLAVLLAGSHWWWKELPTTGAPGAQAVNPTNGILFQTSFEASAYHPGPLAGQDGWLARNGASQKAAMVVASGTGQQMVITGAELETRPITGVRSGWYFRQFGTNAPGLNATRISVAADMEYDPGTANGEAGFTSALLMLNDGRVAPFAAVGLTKNGIPTAQSFAPAAKHLFGRYNTNIVHHMKADFDFVSRQATVEVDGESLGSLPFNPQSSVRPDSVSVLLQSDHIINSVLRVDKLVVSSDAASK